jgi:aryl-phospho-beta-D-glucosidase BglC (GH1 family)
MTEETLAERLDAIHAEAIKDIRSKLVNTTNHDLELLTTGNWGGITKYVAEQILAERKATEASE